MEEPSESRPAARRPGGMRVGTLVGVDVYISTTWVLIAVLFTITLAPAVDEARSGLGSLKYVASFAFVVLFYLSVLLHEMSHAVAAKRFGIQVNSITLSFFGGATEIEGEAEKPSQEFWIAVVGPVTSLLVGFALLPLLLVVPDGLLSLAVGGVAVTNIVVGVLNLVPGLPFDGGRVLRAGVWAASGNKHRSTVIAGWVGRVVAVLVAMGPLWMSAAGLPVHAVDALFFPLLGFFLWNAATASIRYASFRSRLPNLNARALARRTLAVPGDLPLAEAVRRAQEDGAGGIVSLDSAGRPTGIVVEDAVQLVPEERRPWTPVNTVARTLVPGMTFSADLSGEQLITAMQRTPATEYLLLEPDGSIYGVLATVDVDRAFAAGTS
ncbi:MAG TPA: site-2 protease family protein [Nocardioidaceae bacterium]|nr:site-2 protease family protein [Nocardioidaceae bacterium]